MTGTNLPSYTTSATPGLGYRVGASVVYGISSRVSLDFAPGYVFEKSARQTSHELSDGTPAPDHSNGRYTFSWLEMPVFMNYSMLSKGNISWYIGAGISVRNRIYSQEQISQTLGNGFTVDGTYDEAKNNWLFSTIIQVGTKFALPSQSILDLKISYQRSVTPLYKQLSAPPPGINYQVSEKPEEIRLNNLSVTVTYIVQLK